MDILFVNPRTELNVNSKIFHREPPNGLLTLCAILEQAGYDVEFIDLSVQPLNELKNYLSEEPKLVGITSLTNTYNYAMEILQQVKKISTEIITLYGGPHATFKYREILQKNRNVDFILCGEADLTILEFIQRIFDKNRRGEISKVPNLASRSDKEISISKRYNPANLDELPLPARHLLDLQKYQVGTIIVNRGCPFNCSFCVRQRIFEVVRFRKPSDIVHEMGVLSRLGYQFANLYDNINIHIETATRLCYKIQEGRINMRWGCELRADRISSNLAEALKIAGCEVCAVGVESADPRVLKLANKAQDIEKVKKGIKLLKSAGISVQAYFIIGLPGETELSFEKTLELLDNLQLEPGIDRVNFFAATPYPGTALYETPEQFGVHILHEKWDLYDNNNLIMQLDSLDFKKLEEHLKKGQKIEKEFNPF
ncbi:MAG: B12-binding domain-containing radical SAM protein [Candidatus Helarchaeota archaeon]